MRALAVAITAVGVPALVLLAILGGVLSALLLGVAAAAATWRVVPRLRAMNEPWLEPALVGAQAMVVVSAGLTLGGRSFVEVPWLAAVAFGAWSVATEAMRPPSMDGGRQAARRTGTARVRAWIALVGYAVAALLAAAIDGIGAAGSLALALYLLVPAMLLFDLDPADSDDERAWAERRGLDALVGAWLVASLAFHWGVVAVDVWTIAIVVTTSLTGLALANTLATRLATRRHRVPAGAEVGPTPAVTIVVTGRSADPWLRTTLEALVGQTYADATILVVDAGPSAAAGAGAGRLLDPSSLVHPPPAPPGWSVDDWARDVGIRAATGEVVLCISSGTVPAPVALRIMVEQLEARGLALLSAIPRLAMPSAGERAAAPGFAMLPFAFVPIWWSALTEGRPPTVAVADAGLLLVKRATYLAATVDTTSGSSPGGGRGIARALAARGDRVGITHGATLAVRHLDRTSVGAIDRWRRIVAADGASIAVTVGVIALELAAFVAPLLLLPAAILGQAGTPTIAAATVPLAMLVLFRFALAVTQRQPMESIAWHPVAVAIAVVGQVAGLGDRVRGRRVREEVVHSVT